MIGCGRNLKQIKDKYYRFQSDKDFLTNKLQKSNKKLKKLKKEIQTQEKARIILQDLGESHQKEFIEIVESLVTNAISSVFDNRSFEFKLDVQKKRNKLEIEPIIKENGNYIGIKDMGGGILPIIGFALRIILWRILSKKTRPIFFLDEPIKGSLGGEFLHKAFRVYKEISDSLGPQLIIITHYREILDYADTGYLVCYEGGTSKVERIK